MIISYQTTPRQKAEAARRPTPEQPTASRASASELVLEDKKLENRLSRKVKLLRTRFLPRAVCIFPGVKSLSKSHGLEEKYVPVPGIVKICQ